MVQHATLKELTQWVLCAKQVVSINTAPEPDQLLLEHSIAVSRDRQSANSGHRCVVGTRA